VARILDLKAGVEQSIVFTSSGIETDATGENYSSSGHLKFPLAHVDAKAKLTEKLGLVGGIRAHGDRGTITNTYYKDLPATSTEIHRDGMMGYVGVSIGAQ
jgi:hypothetical protein